MSKELTITSSYLELQNTDLADATAYELDGLEIEFPKIKIPSGGGLAFEVPGDDPDSPDIAKEFRGVILHHHPIRSFYAEKYTGGNAPPNCSSYDSRTGSGNPGGSCKSCPLATFGTAIDGGDGKACKERRRVFILREGELFPVLLSLPTMSLKNFTSYVQRLMTKGKRTASVVTKFSLSKATNSGGIEYSRANFAVDRELTAEEKAAIEGLAGQIREMSRSVSVRTDEEFSDIQIDPKTGELIEDDGELPW